MEREISIILKVKGAKEAKDAVQNIFNQQTVTLVKGFNQATKQTGTNMQRVARTSKQASQGVQSFTKTLGRSLSALYLYNRAWHTFGSQFEEGLQLQRASDQFEKNIGNVHKMLPELHSATRGVVADFDLLRTAGRAVQQGLKADQLPKTFKLATVAAQKLNMSATDAINTITQAITRQDEGALNQLGIITNVNQAYKTQSALIAKNGRVMSQAMSIQLRQSLIMKELQKRFGGVNGAQEDGLMILERFRASWKNFRAEVGQTLGAALIPLTKALTGVLDLLTRILDRANDTAGFQQFVKLAGTLAVTFASYKFVMGARTLLTLFGIMGRKGPGAGVVTGLSKVLSTVSTIKKDKLKGLVELTSYTRNLRMELKLLKGHGVGISGLIGHVVGPTALKRGLLSVWGLLQKIFSSGMHLAKWGLGFKLAALFIEPLIQAFSKAWQMGKVFFQLIDNYDESTGLSKVLKKDADELGSTYNLVENLAKSFIKMQARFSGFADGIEAAFKPVGIAVSWVSDKIGDFINMLLGVEKSAPVARSELQELARTWKLIGGMVGGAIAGSMFGPIGALIGGTIGLSSAALSDVDWKAVEAQTRMNPRQTNWAGNSGYIAPTQPQVSTQQTSPEPRAMNLDYSNDSTELLRKMSKQLEGQTNLMEMDSQKQDIRDSQKSAQSNVWTRR